MIYCPNCRKFVPEEIGTGFDQRVIKLGKMNIKTTKQIHCSSCFCFIQDEIKYKEVKNIKNITFGELLE